MNRQLFQIVMPAALCLVCLQNISHAAQIYAGAATLTMQEGLANSVGEFDAYFDDEKERNETLSDPAPGNALFTESATNPGTVSLDDPVRPFGEVPDPYPGTPGSTRSRQITTLDFDPADVLGTWDVSSDDFAFVGSTSLGEQIAFSGMQRWTGPFTGVLLYGDFALRYTGSKLMLASNIDFPNAAFAEIGDPVISVTADTLTISGQLLIGGGLFVLDPSATPGTPFGEFVLTASLSLHGDFNRNGTVDAADYTVWRDGRGASYLPSDYDIWRMNFGRSVAGAITGAAVPEPASVLLILIFGTTVAPIQRRRVPLVH